MRRGPAAVLSLILLVFLTAPCATGATHSDKPYFTDVGQFNYARFLMREGSFEAAAREFGRLIEEFPGSPLLPEAQLRRGEAFFGAGRYRDAERELRLFLANFAESPFAPEAARLYARARDKKTALEARPPWPRGILPPKEPSLRAVQVMLFNGSTPEEVAGELEALKNAGMDTVIIRAFHNKDDRYYPLAARASGGKSLPEAGVYFRTSHAPVVADIVPVITEMAHSKGLRVFAWMTTRYADYGMEDRGDLACRGYDMASGIPVRCKGIDVFNEDAVRRIVAIYRDLASAGIDGILFQDDLVLKHNEGFGRYAAKMFREDTGKDLSPSALYIREGGAVHYTPLFWEWASWKNKRLLDVASRIKAAVREKNPGVRFALNLMYENLTNPPYALAWLSQDLDKSMRAGFDYYSIMAYHRQMSEELGKGPAEIKAMIGQMASDAARIVGDPGKVLIKLQTIDWKTGEPLYDREVIDLVREVRRNGSVSLAVVPYRSDFPFKALGAALGQARAKTPSRKAVL